MSSPTTRARFDFTALKSRRADVLPPRVLDWVVVVVVIVVADVVVVVAAAVVVAVVVVVEFVVAVVVVVVAIVVVVGVALRRRTMPSSPMCQPGEDRVLPQLNSPSGGSRRIPPRTGGHWPALGCGPTCAKACTARPTHGPLT